MHHGTGTQEQQRLEERVRDEMEDPRRVSANSLCKEHVAKL
jgi:hypothetical protein